VLPRGGGRLRGRSNSSQGEGGARVTGAATGKAWDEETLLPGLDVNLIAELTRDDLYISVTSVLRGNFTLGGVGGGQIIKLGGVAKSNSFWGVYPRKISY